jgi:hypothetical protein
MKTLPIARNKNIVVQNAGDETLIYDLVSDKAFCLNSTLTKVYLACDGKTTFDEFKTRHHFTDDLIFFSLDELKRENFIEIDDQYQSPLAKLTRREIAKRIGLSTLIALPTIASVVAPEAINAASLPLPLTPCGPANSNCPFVDYSQGCCNSGLRCVSDNPNPTCFPCRTSGVSVIDFSTAPDGCTPSACNTNNNRNWCCSGTTNAVVVGANLCDCRCA